jgi:hypothetical protein
VHSAKSKANLGIPREIARANSLGACHQSVPILAMRSILNRRTLSFEVTVLVFISTDQDSKELARLANEMNVVLTQKTQYLDPPSREPLE